MAVEKIFGICIVSGKGGVGKSVIALNLTLALAARKIKTLLFDAAGGDLINLSNIGIAHSDKKISRIHSLGDSAKLAVSNFRQRGYLNPEFSVNGILREIIDIASGNDCLIIDCPTGMNAISMTLAKTSEIIAIVNTPEPTAIAGGYVIARALHGRGLSDRCGIVFNQTSSIDEAASLKTRFDIMTAKFLGHTFIDFGGVRQDQQLIESVVEQIPLIQNYPNSSAASDIVRLGQKLAPDQLFQNATLNAKTLMAMGG